MSVSIVVGCRPPSLRGVYLRRLAELLPNDFGDADVWRAAQRNNEFSPSDTDCHVTLPRGHADAMEKTIITLSEG